MGSKDLQRECEEFVCGKDKDGGSGVAGICGATLCVLYAGLKGSNLIEFCQEHIDARKIDMRKFIVFGIFNVIIGNILKTVGLVNSYVERVHVYPLINERGPVTGDLVKYLGGEHHLDEICTLFSCSAKQMMHLLSSHVNYICK